MTTGAQHILVGRDAVVVSDVTGDTAVTATGSTTARMLKDRFGDFVNVKDFGAVGDGITNDNAAVQAAITACADGGCVLFPPGTYLVTSISVTGKALTLLGFGATLTTSSANGALAKTDHNKKLTVFGMRFAGTGGGIKWVTTTSTTQYDEFEITSCRFDNTGVGVYLDGVREGRITSCAFTSCSTGIYRVRTVNTDVVACCWKDCGYGINDDGDTSVYSAGLKVFGGTMLGCTYGVRSVNTDWTVLSGMMIDFCDYPVQYLGVDEGNISDCYITTRSVNPVLYIGSNAGEDPKNIMVMRNGIISNKDDVTSDCVVIRNLQQGLFHGNRISFWWRYGVDFANCVDLYFIENNISPDVTSTAPTKYSLYESADGDNSNKAKLNVLDAPPSVIWAVLDQNRGVLVANGGEGISGIGVTSFTVAHGLDYTPAKYDIWLTPTNAAAATAQPFISAVDATNITIGFVTATGAAAGVAWRVKKRDSDW